MTAAAAAETPDVKMTMVKIADRWGEGWLDKEWDGAKGLFQFRHGPYSDALEHHYVAAVLITAPESKFYRQEVLTRRVVSDLLYHSQVFIEQCRDNGLRGYWTLNSASDKGVPVGSGAWAGHPEPNGDEVWFTKLGCVLSCLLLACPRDPELAVVARHLVEQRLVDHATESFWRGKFNHYFDGHWGSLGLIIETAPVWQKVMARDDLPDFEQL